MQQNATKRIKTYQNVSKRNKTNYLDEIDAVGTKRYDSNSGGEREIQRTMLELLNQLDGFDSRGDTKVSPNYLVGFNSRVKIPISNRNFCF